MAQLNRRMIPVLLNTLQPIPTAERSFAEKARNLGQRVCELTDEQFQLLEAQLIEHHTDGFTDGTQVYTIAGGKGCYALWEYKI